MSQIVMKLSLSKTFDEDIVMQYHGRFLGLSKTDGGVVWIYIHGPEYESVTKVIT